MTSRTTLAAVTLTFAAACTKAHGSDTRPITPQEQEALQKAAQDPLAIAAAKGNQKDAAWLPDEFRAGASRWRDTGVYLDGTPVGMLSFGELPISLQPVWYDEEVSANKAPGSDEPGYRIVKQRRYRFTEYLSAIGVDLAKVKEVHVYGPKFTDSIVVGGKELRARGKDFQFRFGGDVWGKAIPIVPENFGNGRSPDKISGVMVYIQKTPPTLVWNQGMVLNGEVVTNVPYHGEPVRGGIRVYVDDKLALIIKRRLLEEAGGADPYGRRPLMAFLESQGVVTTDIVEGWLIKSQRRQHKLTKEQLANITFEASSQAKGEIHVGPDKLPAAVLAFHTKPVTDDQLPKITADEEQAD